MGLLHKWSNYISLYSVSKKVVLYLFQRQCGYCCLGRCNTPLPERAGVLEISFFVDKKIEKRKNKKGREK